MHEVAGRAVVIHDENGGRVACALLGEGGSLKATFTGAGTKYPGMPADYPEAVSVVGEVTQFITTSPSRVPLTTFDYHLEGLDPRCADGAGRAANSCGIHVHEGTDCQDKSDVGGHFYQTRSDPWKTVAYTAPCSDDDACSSGGLSFEGVFYKACEDQGFGTSKLEDLVAGRRRLDVPAESEAFTRGRRLSHCVPDQCGYCDACPSCNGFCGTCCAPRSGVSGCQDLTNRMATCALEPSKTEKDYVKELVRDGKPVKFDCAGLIEHFPDACYNGGDLVDECEVACKQAIMGCDAFVSKAKPDEPWCSAANEEFVLKYAAGTHIDLGSRLGSGAVDVDAWWNFQVEGYGTADDTSGSHYSSLSTVLADVRGLCPVSCGVCDADAGGSPSGTAQVQAGLGFNESGANMAAGRCLVVHDYDGARIASAPLRPAHDTTPD